VDADPTMNAAVFLATVGASIEWLRPRKARIYLVRTKRGAEVLSACIKQRTRDHFRRVADLIAEADAPKPEGRTTSAAKRRLFDPVALSEHELAQQAPSDRQQARVLDVRLSACAVQSDLYHVPIHRVVAGIWLAVNLKVHKSVHRNPEPASITVQT
jgi:hypothetical protein